MRKKKETIYFLIVLVAGCISFVNARVATLNKINQAKENSQSWLSDEPLSVTESEAQFNNEVSVLISELKDNQSELMDALENPQALDESVLENVDSVNEAHGNLIRKVGRHIVELRKEIGQENQEELMQLCAEAISAPMKRLGARNNEQGSRGANRYGRQNRGTRGSGTGYNQQFRFWNRLTNRLRLTPEQVTQIQQADPNFATESNLLYENLANELQNLLSVFENPQSSDEELLEQIDNLISSHSKVERKIAEHVLVLRSYLTIEQQKWLIGLCRRSQK
ncbi:MAG: hypothetical protein JW787_05410 [Sedimentisphaerales bacterium]|nr:hypothetical protein [Sedimentisphaerales bacterium]